jgi:hypothetical protein
LAATLSHRVPDAMLPFTVSEEDLARLFAAPLPFGGFLPRAARSAAASLMARVVNALAAAVERNEDAAAAARVLAALPRLCFAERAQVVERSIELGAGQTGPAMQAALQRVRRARAGREQRVRALVRAGQVMRAARLAASADAGPLDPAACAAALEAALPRAEVRPHVDGAELEADAEALAGTPLATLQVPTAVGVWRAAVAGLRPLAAAGPDGLTPENLQSLVASRDGASVLAALARLAAALVRQPACVPAFLAARIAFIPKASGAPRPLGVIGVVRRLIVRVLVRSVTPRVAPALVRAGQLGVGAACAPEAVSTALAGRAFAVLDRTNAYGNAVPDAVLATVRGAAPALHALATALLGAAPLVVNGTVTREWRGLFMGCPMSPLLFALVQEAAMVPCRRALRGKALSFLDDTVICDAGEGDVDLVDAASRRYGAALNRSKCVAVGAAVGAMPSAPGALVLGVPCGSEEYVAAAATRLVEAHCAGAAAMLTMLPAQLSLHAVRVGVGTPALTHLLRAVPPRVMCAAAEPAAALVRGVVAALAGVRELSPRAAAIAALPAALGGLGVVCPVRLAPVAYAAGRVGAHQLLQRLAALPVPPNVVPSVGRQGSAQRCARCGYSAQHCSVCCALRGGCAECATARDAARAEWGDKLVLDDFACARGVTPAGLRDAACVAAMVAKPQRVLARALAAVARDAIDGDDDERAALCAGACPFAKGWLQAAGVAEMGPTDVRVALRTRLGMRVLTEPTRCTCVSARGGPDVHARTCALHATRLRGHNCVVAELGAVAADHGAVVHTSPPVAGAGDQRRLDLAAEFGGVTVGIDVTIADACAQHARALRGTLGAVAHARVGPKLAKYADYPAPGTRVLLVWALDSYGAHSASFSTGGASVRAAIAVLVAQCAAAAGVPVAQARKALVTRASAAYFRGLAARYAAHAEGSDRSLVPMGGVAARLWRATPGGQAA